MKTFFKNFLIFIRKIKCGDVVEIHKGHPTHYGLWKPSYRIFYYLNQTKTHIVCSKDGAIISFDKCDYKLRKRYLHPLNLKEYSFKFIKK
jgi:hypothetical protein